MDIMTRKLMKDTVSVVRKKVRAEVERVMEGAMEQVLECFQQSVKTVMKEKKKEMKRVMKLAMREMEQEMELAMEPVIERVKKQEMEPAMEPPMKRAKKGVMEPVKILEMEPPMEMDPAMEQAKKQEMEPAIERAMEQVMEPTFSTQDAPADWNVNQRTSIDHQIKKSAEGELQLLFINSKLPDKIYTNDMIKDDSDGSVEIKLINTISRKTIEEGPLSSMEIKINVLDGDFGSDGHENWTEQEFNAKIVHQRKDKGPLVKGKQNITLIDGVGTIQDLRFSDNSSWIKCKKFRLGAKVSQSTSYMGQVRIKEAITEAFAVRDYRSKMNKKHNLPSLDDEVWHLKKITRKGKFHTRLNDNNIHTIRDFKNMYKTNPIKLREILKDCKIPDWEVIVNDASSVVDDESPVLHQGSTGMQNYKNHASSSHHKGGFSAEETVPNLASQSLATSTSYPVNAQGVQSNSNFHPPTNIVSGRNSSQSNERSFHCSPNYNPLMTESSQINHGLHPHFPAAQHASNAFDDVRRNAYSKPLQSQWEAYNSPTTGSLPHEYPVSSQNNSEPHSHISGVQHASGPLHPQYTAPNQGLAGMQNDCNSASSSQYRSALLKENVPNLTTQTSAMSIQSLNNDFGEPGWTPSTFNFPTSPNSYPMSRDAHFHPGPQFSPSPSPFGDFALGEMGKWGN